MTLENIGLLHCSSNILVGKSLIPGMAAVMARCHSGSIDEYIICLLNYKPYCPGYTSNTKNSNTLKTILYSQP